MSERERLIKEIRAELDEFVFDSDHEAAVQAVMNCIDRAGYQSTPQAGEAEPVAWMNEGASMAMTRKVKELLEQSGAKRQRDIAYTIPLYTAPPNPVCPHLRSSDEGTQWCDLAAVAPVWQPKCDIYKVLPYNKDSGSYNVSRRGQTALARFVVEAEARFFARSMNALIDQYGTDALDADGMPLPSPPDSPGAEEL